MVTRFPGRVDGCNGVALREQVVHQVFVGHWNWIAEGVACDLLKARKHYALLSREEMGPSGWRRVANVVASLHPFGEGWFAVHASEEEMVVDRHPTVCPEQSLCFAEEAILVEPMDA